MIVADTINPLAFKLKLLKVKTSCKIAKLATLLLAMIILALSISLMLLLPCDILFLLLSSVYNCLLLWVTWNIGISRHLVWAGNLSRSAQHDHTLFTYVHRDLHKTRSNVMWWFLLVATYTYIYCPSYIHMYVFVWRFSLFISILNLLFCWLRRYLPALRASATASATEGGLAVFSFKYMNLVVTSLSSRMCWSKWIILWLSRMRLRSEFVRIYLYILIRTYFISGLLLLILICSNSLVKPILRSKENRTVKN